MIRIVILNAIYLSVPSSPNQWMSKVGNPSRDPFLENLGTIVFVDNLGTWLILPSKIPGGSSKWRFQSCQPRISEKLSVKKNRPSNHGATADHSQKHRHFAIFLVSKPQDHYDHSGNNQNSLESHRIIKWFLNRLSETLILSQVMPRFHAIFGFPALFGK